MDHSSQSVALFTQDSTQNFKLHLKRQPSIGIFTLEFESVDT
jgi:hypothetical protein